MSLDFDTLKTLPKALAGGDYPPVALTSEQTRMWAETRAALLWNCPAFSHILYSMMSHGDASATFTSAVPIAATDGERLILNPETFFKYKLPERVFIVAHEIMHCILDHCGQMHLHQTRGRVPLPSGKSVAYDHQTMNVAQDLVINDMLITSKVGQFNSDWMHDTQTATAKSSVIDAYAKLYREGNSGKGGGDGPAQHKGKSGFDQHLKPGSGSGKDPTQAQQQRNDMAWQSAVAAGMAAAKAQGKLPADMEAFFQDILQPKVDWTDKIKGLFARKVGSGSYDWRRPDRRLIVRDIYAPGRSGHNAGLVVIAVDTSGSIGQQALDTFFAEMRGILEDVRPKRTLVMWCDAQVHGVDEIEDFADIGKLKPKGRGGTDFRPVFERIAQEGWEPDALVYLTDLMGPFPEREPTYPVIWGRTEPRVAIPFGDVVDVPIKY